MAKADPGVNFIRNHKKRHGLALFNFINQLYENTSFIITTNKVPAEWAKMLEDEVLATCLLDFYLDQK